MWNFCFSCRKNYRTRSSNSRRLKTSCACSLERNRRRRRRWRNSWRTRNCSRRKRSAARTRPRRYARSCTNSWPSNNSLKVCSKRGTSNRNHVSWNWKSVMVVTCFEVYIYDYDLSIIVLFRYQRPFSTRYNSGTRIQYPTFAIDPRRPSKCLSPGFLDSQAALSDSYPNACLPSREAVCTNFMVVFGMTRPGPEPATHCIRGGHANH